MNIPPKAIAREWILFLASLIIGFLTTWGLFYNSSHRWVPYHTPIGRFDDVLDMAIAAPPTNTNDLRSLIEHTTSKWYWMQTWLSILAPYFIVQVTQIDSLVAQNSAN